MKKKYNLTSNLIKLLMVFMLIVSFGGCGGSTDPVTQAQFNLSDDGDPDSDLLVNKDEKRFGTSIFLDDTDGDGRADNIEIKEGGIATYNAALIAAFPNVQVSLASNVKFELDYTSTEGRTESLDYSLTSSNSRSESLSQSSTLSESISHGWNVDFRADVSLGITAGTSFGVSAGANGQYGTDTSSSIDLGTVRDVSNSIEERISNSQSFDTTYSSPRLRFDVRIKNISPTLGLEASSFNVNLNTLYRGKKVVVASAVATNGNDGVSLQPGESIVIEFEAPVSGQQFDYIKNMNASYFTTAIAGVNIQGVGAITPSGFFTTFDLATLFTRISSRTSLLEINYFDNVNEAEKIPIATARKYDDKGDYAPLSMLEWIDVAGVPEFKFENNDTLVSVKNTVLLEGSIWAVFVYKLNSSAEYELVGSSTSGIYDFMDNFKMEAGLKVVFAKGDDPDDDGIISYYETNRYKTDPLKADTDGDGIEDGLELLGYNPKAESYATGTKEVYIDTNRTVFSNPLLVDTDGDGLDDGVDLYPAQKLINGYADLKINALLGKTRSSVTKSFALAESVSSTNANPEDDFLIASTYSGWLVKIKNLGQNITSSRMVQAIDTGGFKVILGDIALAPDGKLYGTPLSSSGEEGIIYTINTRTGYLSPIATSIPVAGFRSMDFDGDIAYLGGRNNKIYKWNPANNTYSVWYTFPSDGSARDITFIGDKVYISFNNDGNSLYEGTLDENRNIVRIKNLGSLGMGAFGLVAKPDGTLYSLVASGDDSILEKISIGSSSIRRTVVQGSKLPGGRAYGLTGNLKSVDTQSVSLDSTMGSIYFKLLCNDVEETNGSIQDKIQESLSIEMQKNNISDLSFNGSVGKVELLRKLRDFEKNEDNEGTEWVKVYEQANGNSDGCSYSLLDNNLNYLGENTYRMDIYSQKSYATGSTIPGKSFYVKVKIDGEMFPLEIIKGNINNVSLSYKLKLNTDIRYKRVEFSNKRTGEIYSYKRTQDNPIATHTTSTITSDKASIDDVVVKVYDEDDVLIRRVVYAIDTVINRIDLEFALVVIDLDYDTRDKNLDEFEIYVDDVSGKSRTTGEISEKIGTKAGDKIRTTEVGPYERSFSKGNQVGEHKTVIIWNVPFAGDEQYAGTVTNIVFDKIVNSSGERISSIKSGLVTHGVVETDYNSAGQVYADTYYYYLSKKNFDGESNNIERIKSNGYMGMDYRKPFLDYYYYSLYIGGDGGLSLGMRMRFVPKDCIFTIRSK